MMSAPARTPATRSDGAQLLGGLRATAARLINEHVNSRGHCASCGRSWPCTIACRAEFTLGM
jgi:hypothetical protein